jgi:hypothetical protein
MTTRSSTNRLSFRPTALVPRRFAGMSPLAVTFLPSYSSTGTGGIPSALIT